MVICFHTSASIVGGLLGSISVRTSARTRRMVASISAVILLLPKKMQLEEVRKKVGALFAVFFIWHNYYGWGSAVVF